MNDPVSLIVWGALTILIPILVTWLFVLGRKALIAAEAYFKAHATQSQQEFVWNLANQAVLFAEQSGLVDAVKASGAQKYEEATNYVVDELDKQNIHIDPVALDGVINAAVMQQFNQPAIVQAQVDKSKPVPPPPPVPPGVPPSTPPPAPIPA